MEPKFRTRSLKMWKRLFSQKCDPISFFFFNLLLFLRVHIPRQRDVADVISHRVTVRVCVACACVKRRQCQQVIYSPSSPSQTVPLACRADPQTRLVVTGITESSVPVNVRQSLMFSIFSSSSSFPLLVLWHFGTFSHSKGFNCVHFYLNL